MSFPLCTMPKGEPSGRGSPLLVPLGDNTACVSTAAWACLSLLVEVPGRALLADVCMPKW